MKTSKHFKISAPLIAGALLTLFAAGAGQAQKDDSSTVARGNMSAYKPYNETEIGSALQKPLALDDCIGIALSKSISLQIAQGELAKARATHAGSFGAFLPVFGIEGSQENTTEKRPLDVANPTDPTELDFKNSAIVATVQQALPTGAVIDFSSDIRRDLNSPDKFGAAPTRTRNRIYSVQLRQPLLRNAWPPAANSAVSMAGHERRMQEKLFLNAQFETIYAVKGAFYEVLYQRELMRVNQAAIVRDSTLYAASESKVEAKLATRRDVLSAEIQLASDKASFIKSQSEYQLALDALKEVMGLPIEMPVEVADVKMSYAPVALHEERLLRLALENNPSLKSAEAAVKRSRLQLKVAKNQLLPQFDVLAGYSNTFEKDTDQGIDLRTTGFITTINFSYPFLNRAAAAGAENARIALSQQEDNVLSFKRRLALNVRNIVRNTYSSIEAINTLRRTIEAAEQKVDFATTMFNLGRASNLDITDAQEALLKAQTQYVRELVDYHIQLALLESLTGETVTQ